MKTNFPSAGIVAIRSDAKSVTKRRLAGVKSNTTTQLSRYRRLYVALKLLLLFPLFLALTACSSASKPKTNSAPPPIRVAVIGGMVMTGLWQAVVDDFHYRTGLDVELAVTGPKDVLDAEFRKGGIDLVTLHSSDVATNLAADGLATNMRPWARNELVIVGPANDPAHIRGMTSGVDALKKTAASHANFVEARNVGSQTITAHLWSLAGINPQGSWLIKDESTSHQLVVQFAAEHHAYTIVGRIPVLSGKIPSRPPVSVSTSTHANTQPDMQIMVEGDPEMRRPYVVLEAVPALSHNLNPDGARKLADFLTSHEGQIVLQHFALRQGGTKPIFYSIESGKPSPQESASDSTPTTTQNSTP